MTGARTNLPTGVPFPSRPVLRLTGKTDTRPVRAPAQATIADCLIRAGVKADSPFSGNARVSAVDSRFPKPLPMPGTD